ncbi:predicted protein, partial [Nematostella vectensis]
MNGNKRTKVLDNTQTRHTSGVGNMNGNKRTKVLDNTQTRHTSGVGNMNNGNKRTKRLILFLSIAAFLNAVAMFMGVLHPKPGAQCIFQAWWLSFFDYALLLWVCCITFNLYRNAINKVRTEHFENNKRTKVPDNTQTRHTSGVGNMNNGNKRTKVLDNTQSRHTSGVGNMNNGNKRTKRLILFLSIAAFLNAVAMFM